MKDQKLLCGKNCIRNLQRYMKVFMAIIFGIFSFIWPMATVFLRLHKPERYGDNLLSVRESIRFITSEHTFISGFEEGRSSTGYRYIFPLFNGDDYIGSVELSLSPATVIQELYKYE